MDGAAPLFPALTRAKQRFLARRHANRPDPTRATASTRVSSTVQRGATVASDKSPLPPQRASLLERLCATTDVELHTVGLEIDAIDVGVHHTHQLICDDLDAFTAWLVSGSTTTPAQVHASSLDVSQVEDAPGDVLVDSAVVATPPIVSPTSIRNQQLDERNATIATVTTSYRQPAPVTLRGRSRAATLALEAMHAQVLQHYCRRFLYRSLYPNGPQQLASACQLRTRVSLTFIWRRWRAAVHNCRCIARTLAKCAQRFADAKRVHAVCVARALPVRKDDGAFAMAKQFRNTRVLCHMLSAWMRATSSGTMRRVSTYSDAERA